MKTKRTHDRSTQISLHEENIIVTKGAFVPSIHRAVTFLLLTPQLNTCSLTKLNLDVGMESTVVDVSPSVLVSH